MESRCPPEGHRGSSGRLVGSKKESSDPLREEQPSGEEAGHGGSLPIDAGGTVVQLSKDRYPPDPLNLGPPGRSDYTVTHPVDLPSHGP